MMKGSAIALRLIPELVQAHNSLDSSVSLMWVSFFDFSHDKTRLPVSWFLGKYHSEMKCFFS